MEGMASIKVDRRSLLRDGAVTVCSSRAAPTPPTMPPSAWPSASLGLMMRPAS